MKINIEKRILTADEGKFICRVDEKAVYDNVLYLGKFDSEKNYKEVTLKEKEAIIKKLEEEQEKERE